MSSTAIGPASEQDASSLPSTPPSIAHLNAGDNGHHSSNGSGAIVPNGNHNGATDGRRATSLRTTLSSGVSIKGSIKFRSELEIDGNLEGTIESLGRLTVGRNGHVRGDIQTRSVTVHGT